MNARRDFLGGAIGMALLAMLPGCKAASAPVPTSAAAPSPAPLSPDAPPGRARGATRIDVRQHGAQGDGVQDDTAAFQRAIDALPADGGTVEVPSGTYLIDPLQSVRLRGRMHLQLAPDARLVAKPNAADRAYVLWILLVDDVEVSGGRIVGERDRHLGTTGEWGHGIQIVGASRVTVRDMQISDCWGDGICIGGRKPKGGGPKVLSSDVVIDGVVSTGNRRQGLSITGSRDVRVTNSEFSHTAGTAPQCGIDIEPDKPDFASNVHIQNCRIHDNAAYGILAYKRTRNVTIEDCTIQDNRSCGVVLDGCATASIIGNSIRDNGSTGLLVKNDSSDCSIGRNTFANNRSGKMPRPGIAASIKGASPRVARDILVQDAASDIRVDTNTFL
ncbi:right-handed parallel beta-helix repeat-containing protein [Cognatiluteimonas profundi]|uniref:right-handed parallel beta-helix repeat-containing protein n=1 Tax=Cognatiluteimonas profundi TaxID=2594501 RepID=UPI00131B635B|nr:right-handed parallel beta-helix repeat-containing protein [Lysobacter profundi]